MNTHGTRTGLPCSPDDTDIYIRPCLADRSHVRDKPRAHTLLQIHNTYRVRVYDIVIKSPIEPITHSIFRHSMITVSERPTVSFTRTSGCTAGRGDSVRRILKSAG